MSTEKEVVNQGDAGYDRGITSAETAARMEREGGEYKETPQPKGSIDTTGGMTVDKEGIANNYAIEPEMYYEERGDLEEKEKALAAEREQELKEVNQEGGKGPGVI
ncbi:hypothetical protein [Lusitaniella coriacea]|uniref:hypothetical protein n=1 Tax=Lusitaniella coriacea TaxID=1983105 RepID=UPI003CF093B4